MKYSLSLFSCLLFITLCAPIICGDDQTEKSITPKSDTQNQNATSKIEYNHSTDLTDEDLKIEENYRVITELLEGFDDQIITKNVVVSDNQNGNDDNNFTIVDISDPKKKSFKNLTCLKCIIL